MQTMAREILSIIFTPVSFSKHLQKSKHSRDTPGVLRRLNAASVYYTENLFDEQGVPIPFSHAPRLTVYRRELYDYAECINLGVLLRGRFPRLDDLLSIVLDQILTHWQKPDGSFRSRQLHLGWDNTPMHRWASSQLFRSLCFMLYRNTPNVRLEMPETDIDEFMCGICGQYNFASQAPVERRDLEQMTRTMVHRGPDDEGYYLDGALGFGFRRLSIIDLEGGHQPMSDREKTVWVVFNGEIYNFPELKRDLEDLGHVFRTRCDTEVIVLGYKQWGDEILNRLNGMFGLAIWDTRQKRLVIARDPFGVKPVYYRVEKGQLFFGSEIRAVIATADERPEVDPVALNLFLRYRFTPSPHTLFAGVKKLAPGSMLIFEKGAFSLRLWYRFKPVPFSPVKSVGEAREELLELYNDP